MTCTNVASVIDQIESTVARQQSFSRLIIEARKPPSGPYALFYHHGHFIERLNDVALILERMGRARARITTLNERQAKFEAKRPARPGPVPKALQRIFSERHKLTTLMRLDNESLYVFGNLTLDQWALTIAYALGLARPETYDFHRLVMQLQAATVDPKLATMQQRHLRDAIWLYYQLRFYRNIFIEHVRRPWQRGSTMSAYGADFNFFIPTPVDWIPKDKEQELINSIKHLAPEWIRNLRPDDWRAQPRAVLEATFKQIDDIPTQHAREQVWNVWKEIGGSVVSFAILGTRLVGFVQASTETMFEAVQAGPQSVNLGASSYRQEA